MSFSRMFAFAVVLAIIVDSRWAAAQMLPPPTQTVELSGPRFGLTVLPDATIEELSAHGLSMRPYITQVGWQFERQFFTRDGGTAMVTELVTLIGGLELNKPIPSVSWLVGFRTRDGIEFGIGPNLSPVGPALVLAAGVTVRMGIANVPFNVAVVPSRSGPRVTVMSGFSLRTR